MSILSFWNLAEALDACGKTVSVKVQIPSRLRLSHASSMSSWLHLESSLGHTDFIMILN